MGDPLDLSNLTIRTDSCDPLILCEPIDETTQLPEYVTDDFIDKKWKIYNRIQYIKHLPKHDGDEKSNSNLLLPNNTSRMCNYVRRDRIKYRLRRKLKSRVSNIHEHIRV